MGIFDLFRATGDGTPQASATSTDAQAIARYRYLLRTAPPETVEQAHAEAFAQLTSEQRKRVLDELAGALPEGERAAALRAGGSPASLARTATRAELRQPGVLERALGAAPATGAPSLGGMFAGSLFASMAGTVIGSAIAQHFFLAQPAAAGMFGAAAHDGGSGSAGTPEDALAQPGDDAPDAGFDDGGFFDA